MTKPYTFIIMSGADMDAMLKAEKPDSKGIGGFDKEKVSFIIDSSVPSNKGLREVINNAIGLQAGNAPFDTHLFTVIPTARLPELEEKFNLIRVTGAAEIKPAKDSLHQERLKRLGIEQKSGGMDKE